MFKNHMTAMVNRRWVSHEACLLCRCKHAACKSLNKTRTYAPRAFYSKFDDEGAPSELVAERDVHQ